jgi:O-methyltransferase
MLDLLERYFSKWKRDPRKFSPKFIVRGIWAVLSGLYVRQIALRESLTSHEELLILGPKAGCVEMLQDKEFSASVEQVKEYTLLDIARLANLWNMVRMVGPGAFVEVGTFRGGTALHICNAMLNRDAPFYCFDPFEKGTFENISDVDGPFIPDPFTKTRFKSVVELLSPRPNAKVIQGYFPAAATDLNLQDIAFCHLDVDIYDATRKCLEYLAPRLAPRGIIVVDDYGVADTPGVKKAVDEFLAERPSFLLVSMFPVQALLLPKSLW